MTGEQWMMPEYNCYHLLFICCHFRWITCRRAFLPKRNEPKTKSVEISNFLMCCLFVSAFCFASALSLKVTTTTNDFQCHSTRYIIYKRRRRIISNLFCKREHKLSMFPNICLSPTIYADTTSLPPKTFPYTLFVKPEPM